MQGWRRRSFALLWCVGLGLSGVAATLACLNHPTVHAGAYPHPSLCLDANTPVVVEGRQFRSPSMRAITVGSLGDLIVHLPAGFSLPSHKFFYLPEHHLFSASASIRRVLQL